MVKHNGTYIIMNLKGKTVIDMSPTPDAYGDFKVSGFGPKPEPNQNQRWTLVLDTSGCWTLQNNYTGKYLAYSGDKAINAAQIVASDKPYKWDIWPVDPVTQTYRIGAPNSLLVLDLYNFGESTPGNKITLWNDTGASQQRWSFQEVSCAFLKTLGSCPTQNCIQA